MRTTVHIGGALIVLLALVVVLYFFWHDSPEQGDMGKREAVPVIAPDFSFPDASGKQVVLSEVKAKVRVVNFWASWSPYSKDELPILVAIKKDYAPDVVIIALNRDIDPQDGRTFLSSLNMGDEIVFAYDQGDTYFKEVGGYNMPETLFVGPDGEVLAHVHGPMSEEDMRTRLDTLLQ